ncbi:hypothetical protein D5085_12530 [Ectothiorhodospiraceae bacterium BW-2]|nr:hypothetical protein D5085_12530 [Ectothiorhodospiraceae bacterium BW-2]
MASGAFCGVIAIDERHGTPRQAIDEQAKAADLTHAATVHRMILADLMDAGVDERCARAVITAIAKGMVPNVTIRY